MKNKLIQTIANVSSVILFLSLTNCGNNNSNRSYGPNANNNNVEAVTPIAAPTNFCLTNYSNSNCNQHYGQVNGFMNYPYNPNAIRENFNSGFCHCPTNYRPVYNSNWGLGCMEGRFAVPLHAQNQLSFMSYFWNSQNSQWTQNPQVPSYGTNNNSCYQDAILTCDATNPNSCGGRNSRCVSVNGSAVGICQFNPTNYYRR